MTTANTQFFNFNNNGAGAVQHDEEDDDEDYHGSDDGVECDDEGMIDDGMMETQMTNQEETKNG